MQNIQFEYNYILFMKMLAGQTGVMGINFWKAILAANTNDLVYFADAWDLMNQLAIESTLVFMTYNVAFHKKAVHETLKIKFEAAMMSK